MSYSERFTELIEIMRRLQSEDGCPWDRDQTHQSLKRYFLEEVYEFLEAVDNRDDSAMMTELGDCLLQIVFHAQIADERDAFTIEDSINSIITKLKNRHPHIFGDAEAKTPEDVLDMWEESKSREKKRKHPLETLPKSLPALIRALRAGERMAGYGFDWTHPEDILEKVEEEIEELKVEMEGGDTERIGEEIGDLIFVLVNLARHYKLEPEDILNKTTDKAIKRFHYILDRLSEMDRDPHRATLDEMEELWQEAKGDYP
jgi:tetrapyrrole methylase family protein/MazG family protein